MILDAVLEWAFGTATDVVGLLPSISVDCSALGGMSSGLALMGNFIDLPVAGATLGAILVIEFGSWLVQGVVWLWHQVPFVG